MNIYNLITILSIVIAICLIINNKISRLKDNKLGWRAYRKGRDEIIYEEKVHKNWKRIEIDAEILRGKINLVIYFRDKKEWENYPLWGQDREKIIERVKTKFPPKNTEYENI